MLDLHPLSAERQGFEPRVPRSTTVFKTAAIDHSATSPILNIIQNLINLLKAERQALELILSQNIIKLQTTDNQV